LEQSWYCSAGNCACIDFPTSWRPHIRLFARAVTGAAENKTFATRRASRKLTTGVNAAVELCGSAGKAPHGTVGPSRAHRYFSTKSFDARGGGLSIVGVGVPRPTGQLCAMCTVVRTCMRSELHRWLRLERSPRSPHRLPLIS